MSFPITLPSGDLIRDAAIEDLPQIVAIYNAAIPGRLATADTQPVTVESRRAWFSAHDSQRRPLWVLERDEQVIAWVGLQDFYGRPAYHATCEVSLYVAPAFQGREIGLDLLEVLIDACPNFGVKTLLGFVFGHNRPSLRAFEKLGFLPWGMLPEVAELDGEWKDLVILGRRVEDVE
jgi:L-amino acid N-acyltransferase YncA